MDPFRLTLAVAVESLENRTVLAEAMFVEDLCLLRGDSERVLEALGRGLALVLKEVPRHVFSRIQGATDATIEHVPLTLDPPKGSVAWREPVTLDIPIARWNHAHEAVIARVPSLEIEILASTAEELAERLPGEIKSALLRAKHANSLGSLVWLSRVRKVRIAKLDVELPLESLKKSAMEEQVEKQEPPEKVLKEIGTNLALSKPSRAYEVQSLVERLAESFTSRQPKSVLLVGPAGVGKTAIVHQLVRRRKKLGLERTPIWATSGARLVAGMSGFGMWQERCQRLWRAASKLHAILHLGNLVELMEVGKSSSSGQSIAGFLRPYLARGDLLAIVECTPEQWTVIERTDPHLLDVFQRIDVPEPTPAAGQKILTQFANETVAAQSKQAVASVLDGAALETLDRLHRRYASYSAYPGRPLRFLRNLLQEQLTVVKQGNRWRAIGDVPSAERPRITASTVTAAFARETGLPVALVDDEEMLDLEAARVWFSQRVIGQSGVVDLVVDLLATIKSGLGRPKRPLASLMFIGPTGVGKTEMAKSLAEYLFGDAHRLTRFDMSEYGDRLSVSRLIGGIFGAEGLLTAKVREQPFSVVLFDEFEKAHGSFGDLLLQVLGEARLTDAGGRLADFTNAVIVLTSNLGAENFNQGSIGYGKSSGTEADAHEHFERAVRQFVRPELYNRFDRIVPFAPLSPEVVRQIAARQLEQLHQRDGLRYREVKLEIAPAVIGHVGDRGFDARYGARPLKRAIERELLADMASQMNAYSVELPLEASVTLAEGKLVTEVRAQTGKQAAQGASSRLEDLDAPEFFKSDDGDSLVRKSIRITWVRRFSHRLSTSPAALELSSDVFRLEKLAERLARRESRRANKPRFDRDGKPIHVRGPGDATALTRLPVIKSLATRIEALERDMIGLEDEAMLTLYSQADAPESPEVVAAFGRRVNTLYDAFRDLTMSLYLRQFPHPDRVTLGLFSSDSATLLGLAKLYLETAQGLGVRIHAVQYTEREMKRPWKAIKRKVPVKVKAGDETVDSKETKDEDHPSLWSKTIDDLPGLLASPPTDLKCLVMSLHGPGVFARFGPEAGTHVFVHNGPLRDCLVESGDDEKYLPDAGFERRSSAGVDKARLADGHRRIYQLQKELIEDRTLNGEQLSWFNRGLSQVVAEVINKKLWQNAYGILAR